MSRRFTPANSDDRGPAHAMPLEALAAALDVVSSGACVVTPRCHFSATAFIEAVSFSTYNCTVIWLQPETGFWQNEPKIGDSSWAANDLAVFQHSIISPAYPSGFAVRQLYTDDEEVLCNAPDPLDYGRI
jgi:hypothetical protein